MQYINNRSHAQPISYITTYHRTISQSQNTNNQQYSQRQSYRCTHMIGICIPPWPILLFPITTIFILLPKLLYRRPNFWGCLDFLKSQFGIILHTCRLTFRHFDTICLGDFTYRIWTGGAVMCFACVDHGIVFGLFVPQILNGHILILGWCRL